MLIENDTPAGPEHTMHSGIITAHSLHTLQSSNCPSILAPKHARVGFSSPRDRISLSTAPVRAHKEGSNEARVNTARFKREASLQL